MLDRQRQSVLSTPNATLTVRVKGAGKERRGQEQGKKKVRGSRTWAVTRVDAQISILLEAVLVRVPQRKLANVIMGAGKFKICRLDQQTGDLR